MSCDTLRSMNILIRTATFLSVALGAATFSSPSQATTFVVDRADDDAAATGCDDATANDCSLRGAIIKANAAGGADIITLPSSPAPYLLSLLGTTEQGGDLDITDDLTINGGGAATTIVDGNGSVTGDRVFQIAPAGFPVVVSINNLAVQNGKAPDSSGGLSNTGEPGGGISIGAGTINLSNLVVRNNATGKGAAAFGPAFPGGAGGSGGGIAMGNATVTLDRVTVSDNTTAIGGPAGGPGQSVGPTGGGAGIWVASGTATMTNSTVSGNLTAAGGPGGANGGGAGGNGGGILINSGSLSLNNVTIADNTTSAGGSGTPAGPAGSGGGLFRDGGTVTLKNTLIADNAVASGGTGPDCEGAVTTQGFNLVGDGTNCSGPADGVLNDHVGSSASPIDALLGLLQDNGGPLPTQALASESPAVNAGDNATCEMTDERGLSRPHGPACDIGAFEKGGCGDSFPEPEEECDDGNITDGDGCSASCQIEGGGTGGTTTGGGMTGGTTTGTGTGTSTGGTGDNGDGGGCSLIR